MFKNTSLLKYSKKYSHFSYITINLISCIIFKFMSTWSGTTMSTSWRRQWHPTPVLLPGKSHGWRSLVGCSPWGRSEVDTTERLHVHFSLSCTGEGDGNPLQCSCLENPRDWGAWWAVISGVAQSRTWLKWLSSMSTSIWVWREFTIEIYFSTIDNSCRCFN